MSDNCENFKSPSALGLRICTSDVPCYDGLAFECIPLPSNPSLNDVLKSIDEAHCELINLINSGGGNVPNDDWVEFTNVDMIAINYTGTAGGTPIDRNMNILFQYKVTSPDSAVVKCNVTFEAPITGILDFTQFNFTIPDITGSNWFSGNKQMVATDIAFTRALHVPVSLIATDGTGQQYVSKGRAGASNNLFSVGFCQPNIANGSYNFEIDFEMTCRLVDA